MLPPSWQQDPHFSNLNQKKIRAQVEIVNFRRKLLCAVVTVSPEWYPAAGLLSLSSADI